MNPVGKTCVVCNRTIAAIMDGDGCPDCSIAFHHQCVSKPSTCPKCSTDLEEVRSQARERESAADRKVQDVIDSTGKRVWLFVIFGAVANTLVGIYGVHSESSVAVLDFISGALGWFILWAIWAWSKRRAARKAAAAMREPAGSRTGR